jgi:hypothetical protein
MKETKTIGIKVLPFPVTAVEREPSHELTRRLGPPSAPLTPCVGLAADGAALVSVGVALQEVTGAATILRQHAPRAEHQAELSPRFLHCLLFDAFAH